MFKTLTLLFSAAVTMVAAAADIEWMTDLKAAGKKAAAEDKLLLVEFTGSDWCSYCIQQKKAVLDKPEFAEWANKHCIAVEIDIPQDATRVGGEAKKAANKRLSEEYGISNKRAACILDTFSCVFQGVIPYGAQMLVAISACAEMGVALSAFNIMRYLFYPYLLLVSSLVAIYLVKEKNV